MPCTRLCFNFQAQDWHTYKLSKIKCWHARRLLSPLAGSGPRHYCILGLPLPPLGTTTAPSRLQHGGGVAGVPVGLTRFGLGGGLAAASSPPALSELSESHMCSCQATRDQVRSIGRGRPATPWRAAGRRIQIASEWRELRHWAQPAGGSLPRRCRLGAGAGLRGRPLPAGLSITKGGWVGSKKIGTHGAVDSAYQDFLISRDSIEFIFEEHLIYTLY